MLRGDGDRDSRPLAGRRTNGELALDQLGALAHPDQPEAARAVAGVEAGALVANLDLDAAVRLADGNGGAIGDAMLGDVRERLLHEPVDRALDVRGPARRIV